MRASVKHRLATAVALLCGLTVLEHGRPTSAAPQGCAVTGIGPQSCTYVSHGGTGHYAVVTEGAGWSLEINNVPIAGGSPGFGSSTNLFSTDPGDVVELSFFSGTGEGIVSDTGNESGNNQFCQFTNPPSTSCTYTAQKSLTTWVIEAESTWHVYRNGAVVGAGGLLPASGAAVTSPGDVMLIQVDSPTALAAASMVEASAS